MRMGEEPAVEETVVCNGEREGMGRRKSGSEAWVLGGKRRVGGESSAD